MSIPTTSADLSKILGDSQNIRGGQKVTKTDESIGVSQLLGAHARAAPQVYAYDTNRENLYKSQYKISGTYCWKSCASNDQQIHAYDHQKTRLNKRSND